MKADQETAKCNPPPKFLDIYMYTVVNPISRLTNSGHLSVNDYTKIDTTEQDPTFSILSPVIYFTRSYLRSFGLECTFSALFSTPDSAMLPWMTRHQSKILTSPQIHGLFYLLNIAAVLDPEKIHSCVKTWTRRVDLFLKDYIILPVCDR